MKLRISEILRSLLISCIILVLLELFSSTILPIIGLKGLRLSFNILIILFLTLRLNSAWLPYCILVIQLVHSVFSIEGWAIGTIAGLVISGIINALKDVIHMNSAVSTMVVVQTFQLVWFLLVNLMLGFKVANYGVLGMFFFSFLGQSIVLSILSPYMFYLFERIWKPSNNFSSTGVSI